MGKIQSMRVGVKLSQVPEASCIAEFLYIEALRGLQLNSARLMNMDDLIVGDDVFFDMDEQQLISLYEKTISYKNNTNLHKSSPPNISS